MVPGQSSHPAHASRGGDTTQSVPQSPEHCPLCPSLHIQLEGAQCWRPLWGGAFCVQNLEGSSLPSWYLHACGHSMPGPRDPSPTPSPSSDAALPPPPGGPSVYLPSQMPPVPVPRSTQTAHCVPVPRELVPTLVPASIGHEEGRSKCWVETDTLCPAEPPCGQ